MVAAVPDTLKALDRSPDVSIQVRHVWLLRSRWVDFKSLSGSFVCVEQ